MISQRCIFGPDTGRSWSGTWSVAPLHGGGSYPSSPVVIHTILEHLGVWMANARLHRTIRPRCSSKGSKSRSSCNRMMSFSKQKVAIMTSMVLRTVTPFLRKNR